MDAHPDIIAADESTHTTSRRDGPLVAHFAELGRRYAHLLEAPLKPRLFLVPNLGDGPGDAGTPKRRRLPPPNRGEGSARPATLHKSPTRRRSPEGCQHAAAWVIRVLQLAREDDRPAEDDVLKILENTLGDAMSVVDDLVERLRLPVKREAQP